MRKIAFLRHQNPPGYDAAKGLMQNTRNDRQVKHKSKKEGGFWRDGIETPLSIGLPLSVHSRV